MSLAIPNTTSQDIYTAATTFPPEQGAGTPFASGYIVIANNPCTVSVLRGTGQGSASWGADFSFTPTTLPLSAGLDPSTGKIRDYIFGVRFKSAVPGSPAQVFGGLFQLGDVTLSPANQFTGALSSSGKFTPPGSSLITGIVLSTGAINNGTGFTVAKGAAGIYTVTYTTPYPGTPVVVVTVAQGPSPTKLFAEMPTSSSVSFDVNIFSDAGVLTDATFNFLSTLAA